MSKSEHQNQSGHHWSDPAQIRPSGAANSSSTRSQDDATVAYFFQRPQNDTGNGTYNKRWAAGDDSVIEQARAMGGGVQDLEREFHNLTFEDVRRDNWGAGHINAGHKGQQQPVEPRNSYSNAVGAHAWSSRDDSNAVAPVWSGAQPPPPPHHPTASGLVMSQLRRPGSFPGSETTSVLSPRSSETGVLGVNMAEYVLDGSPLGRIKHFGPGGDADVGKLVKDSNGGKAPSPFEGEQAVVHGGGGAGDMGDITDASNGLMPNGLDVHEMRTSRQNSPAEEREVHVTADHMTQMQMGHMQGIGKPELGLCLDPHQAAVMQQQVALQQLDAATVAAAAQHFEPVAIDPFQQVDYQSHLVAPSMDSPNFSVDYSAQQQQPIAVLTHQYALAQQQQQQLAGGGAQYVLGSQPPGAHPAAQAAAHPGVHPAPPPDGYQIGHLQVQGGQVLAPFYQMQTPWGVYPATNILPQGGTGTPQPLTPQQGQILRGQMSGRPLTPNSQEQPLGTPTGLQQPPLQQQPGTPGYQILTAPTAYYDQNGQLVQLGNNRGVGTPVRLVSPAPVQLVGQQGGGPMRFPPGPPSQPYTSNSSTPNLPDGTPGRRDSLGSLDRRHMQQYYGPLSGAAAGSPAGHVGMLNQSVTPPPSLSSSSTNYSLAAGMLSPALSGVLPAGRLPYSAAPGAEAKLRQHPLPTNGIFGGASLFPGANAGGRMFGKNQVMQKEVAGRSRLLEDFRNNRIPQLQLKDLVNHVVEFSQDQHGSRFIQQKLERASPPEKAMVFNEILTAAYSLMTDVFGNYVIQKFFEFGSPDQKQTLAQRVRGHVLPLALQMYGCRVIQKALESIPPEMQIEIVKELDGHVLKCVKDQNGNHVVQKCIECIDPHNLGHIISAFDGQVFALSTHPYGCRVIQRILEHCTGDQTMPILDELHQHTERLVQDQYGNYVIQHVLEHGRPEDKSKIVQELRGKILVLSQHKFASNVVEKCIAHSSRQERAALIEEICVADGTNNALYTMMKDQFANYVVQKMIDVAEPQQRKILMHKIRPHVQTLRKFTYGKHILAKLEKYYMKNSDAAAPFGGALS